MWQRIQTLYLAISTILVAVLFFSTAFTYNEADGLREISYLQLQKPYFAFLLGVLAAIVLLALVTFKVRILQMRLSVLSAMVALGMQIWLTVMYFQAPEGIVFKWTAVFPIVITILNMLAARGCYQDQLMVESAYRIRESRRKRGKK